jgi:membrane-bound lytic murein transglycosylase D
MPVPITVRLLLLLVLLGLALPGRAAPDDRPAPLAPLAQLAMTTSLSGDAGAEMPLPPLPLSVTLPVQAIQEDAPLPPLIDLTTAPDDLWQRIRNGFGMPDLHNPLVADRQSWYLNRPDMTHRIFERSRRYLYHIVEELEKRGMPTELALLPMVESAFNPQAVSSARAMGMWQFIPATGKNYNLDQNWWVDERRDIIASTDAALNYLQTIYEMNGDWHLALASYNWGENAVARAMAKNEAKGLPTDYSSLTMPAETRYYVPKLQALKNIIAQPELFGFRLPGIPNQAYFDTVVKPPRMDVAVAARLAEIPIEEFVSLNPAYHRPVMNGHQAGPLVLPAGKVDIFRANLERYEAQDIPLSNWQTYQMKRGDTLDKVAGKYGIDTARLKQINGITRRLRVGPGFNLLVPRPGSQANPDLIARALPQLPAPKAVKQVRKGKSAKSRSAGKTSRKSAVKPVAKKVAKAQPKKKP